MSPNRKVGVLGGDKRQYYIAKQLLEEGMELMLYAVEDAASLAGEHGAHVLLEKSLAAFMDDSDLIIGPVPFSRDGSCIYAVNNDEQMDQSICAGSLDTFCSLIRERHIITGGNIPEQLQWVAGECGASCYDLMKVDRVAAENAVATAEGTIAEAICSGDGNLSRSHCLIFGYGKCGKTLAERLNGMKAYVTIAARNEAQLQDARNKGYETVELSALKENRAAHANMIKEAGYIFNTIPAPVITREILELVDQEALIIDIASKPGGTDFAECKNLGIKAKLSLGIPGRYAPRASAEILLRAMRHLFCPPSE
ncbi:MAG: dipicolinate synthase subunit DpsA [bacterium]|nr:dipicolinate synthase subunit DpsA [bacterium]